MLELDELKRLHDKAYTHGQTTRDKASDDLIFANITQWDDNLLGESQLQYRGEFNIIRKARRDIQGKLRANPIQVDFEPEKDGSDDQSDLLDGLYRSSDRINTSLESYNNATQESIDCGYGAWELFTEYESNAIGDQEQVIKRRPLYEACNNVFCDPNAKLIDKSDADYWSILVPYSEDGYKKLVSDLQGIPEEEVDMSSFASPNQAYVFPWVYDDDQYYVTRFYHRELVIEKNITLEDPFGQTLIMRDFELDKIEDELLDSGFEIIDEKKVERYRVTLYIASGSEIIHTQRIAGQELPVVPQYGERAFVEGEEHYEGITRLAKDPQRLRNFQLSYLADIVSRSPRRKPIFTQEQIAGFEFMYEDNGPDNNYPYLLQNSRDANGNPIPVGAIGEMPEQPMPQSLAVSIELSRQAVEDVANPGLPQNIADPDLSGRAVYALQNMIDNQYYVYQDNMKFAKRRDGEIYASMASEVYDTPREVTLTAPDGTRKTVQMMTMMVDEQSGEIIPVNDITGTEFKVYADIGHSYDTKREETLEKLAEMAVEVQQSDPVLYKAILLKRLNLMGGIGMDDIRDYANKQLVLMGFKKPETPEEQQILMQAQAQQGQPDPQAMALQMEGEARIMEGQAALQDKVNDANKIAVDQFNAETKRIDTVVKAQEAGVNIENTQADTQGKMIDNAQKAIQSLRGVITQAQAL